MYGNTFYGQLPDKFESFKKLTSFEAASNKFNGSVPASILNSLANCSISLRANDITSIPWDEWTNSAISSTQTIDLSFNIIEGSLSPQIYWPSKTALTNNRFTGTLPNVFDSSQSPSLKSLQLDNNYFSGNLPAALAQSTTLATLIVSGNSNMSGVIPEAYANMRSIYSLYFYRTNLDCPSNKNWDQLFERAYTDCPDQRNQDKNDLVINILLYIGGIFALLLVAALIIFFTIRKPKQTISV